jgi:hypothetical protein
VLAALHSSQKLALDRAGRHGKKKKSAFSSDTCNKKTQSNKSEKMLLMLHEEQRYVRAQYQIGVLYRFFDAITLLHPLDASSIHPQNLPCPKMHWMGVDLPHRQTRNTAQYLAILNHPASLPRLLADLVLSMVCLACRLGFDGLAS